MARFSKGVAAGSFHRSSLLSPCQFARMPSRLPLRSTAGLLSSGPTDVPGQEACCCPPVRGAEAPLRRCKPTSSNPSRARSRYTTRRRARPYRSCQPTSCLNGHRTLRTIAQASPTFFPPRTSRRATSTPVGVVADGRDGTLGPCPSRLPQGLGALRRRSRRASGAGSLPVERSFPTKQPNSFDQPFAHSKSGSPYLVSKYPSQVEIDATGPDLAANWPFLARVTGLRRLTIEHLRDDDVAKL